MGASQRGGAPGPAATRGPSGPGRAGGPGGSQAEAMDWERYRRICEDPRVVSRWLVERTAHLLGAPLAGTLRAVLAGAPLAKPAGHKGGAETDMFAARLPAGAAKATLAALRTHAGLPPGAAPTGPLRGIIIAWQELCAATGEAAGRPAGGAKAPTAEATPTPAAAASKPTP